MEMVYTNKCIYKSDLGVVILVIMEMVYTFFERAIITKLVVILVIMEMVYTVKIRKI